MSYEFDLGKIEDNYIIAFYYSIVVIMLVTINDVFFDEQFRKT